MKKLIKVGIIEVPATTLLNHHEAWQIFQGLQLVPVKIDEHAYAGIYHVFGISPYFDPLEDGQLAPHYDIVWSKSDLGDIHLVEVRKHGKIDS